MNKLSRWDSGKCIDRRWTLGEPIAKWHVWYVTDSTGRTAVMKRPRHGGKIALLRFYDEVKGLEALSGTPGILPQIDRDRTDEPTWFVMPLATPLADHLANSDFGAIVEVFAELAGVLAGLAARAQPVAHRDIKPENLFWHDQRPVLGDFGIAAWFDGSHVTQEFAKIGPIAFMAPEALSSTDTTNWHAADVYSLAKSIWSIAAPRLSSQGRTPTKRVVDPPQGSILVSEPQHSLKHFGGSPAKQLDLLFQEATSNFPTDRPTAAEFHDELQSWLRMNPGPNPPPMRSGGNILSYEDIKRYLQRRLDAEEAFLRLLLTELRQVLWAIEPDDSVTVDHNPRGEKDADGTLKSAAIMTDHGRGPEDEWDGALVLRLQSPDDELRVIVGGVLDSPTHMDLVAEAHHRDQNGHWAVSLTQDIDNLHPGRPLTTEQMRNLLYGLTAQAQIPETDESNPWPCTRIL